MGYGTNFPVVKHLIENGLDVSNYIYDLTERSISYSTHAAKYFINMGISVDELNKLLPIACNYGNIASVNLLLESGADAHYDNNYILDFMHVNSHWGYYNTDKWYTIVKILIKRGAISNNPLYTFCLYIANIYDCVFDEELFTYFLDGLINPDDKLDPNIKCTFKFDDDVTYILDAVVYLGSNQLFNLCLKYGADPFINNHMPLQLAIKYDNLVVIKILLDLGSVVDHELTYMVDVATINLLNQYSIPHKLQKKLKK
jgi:ankyrin repeat protein